MLKTALLISTILLLTGCTGPVNVDQTVAYSEAIPDELKDCSFHLVKGDWTTNHITVVRCPNSTVSTSYMQGKTQQTVVVIDGVEYVKQNP